MPDLWLLLILYRCPPCIPRANVSRYSVGASGYEGNMCWRQIARANVDRHTLAATRPGANTCCPHDGSRQHEVASRWREGTPTNWRLP